MVFDGDYLPSKAMTEAGRERFVYSGSAAAEATTDRN